MIHGHTSARMVPRAIEVTVLPAGPGPEVRLTIHVAGTAHSEIVVPLSELPREVSTRLVGESNRPVPVNANAALAAIANALHVDRG